MERVESLEALRSARSRLESPVGLVPTMGFLHEGHLSLVRRARASCASLVVSIFINPTQFGPAEDLASYPVDLPRDLDLLARESVDLVWTPPREIMYPPDFQTWVAVEDVSRRLEGEMRPGHFRGVATVVAKLFNAVQPDKAYFGQKDAQQAIVIRQMARDLNFGLEIEVCPTVREPDGLAMSSRNVYLDQGERQAAVVLYQSLYSASQRFAAGENRAEALRRQISSQVESEPLARLQYVSCADPETLDEIEGEIAGRALLSMAVFIGRTRLIDNWLIGD